MNFDLLSDLHLRSLDESFLENIKPASNVLVLLGDICEINQVKQMLHFFKQLNKLWDYILYVPGNHEFYGGHLTDTVSILRSHLKHLKNIVVMDNNTEVINGIAFIGSTLWTDHNKGNIISILNIENMLNDYNMIRVSPILNDIRVKSSDIIHLFNICFKYISDQVKKFDSCVILTHHAPTYLSISQKYKESIINGAFASELSDFILDNPQIKVWAHGHVHSKFDYKLGNCRIITNPYGYRNEIYSSTQLYKPLNIVL